MAFKDPLTWSSMWDEDGYLTEDGKLVAAGVYMVVVMILLRYVREALIRAYPSNVRKFVPYKINAKNKRDVVCVDCTHPSFPTLTHHKDCKTTPNYLRGDTSTDTVLNALTASGGWEPMRVASKVTCNHVRARRPPPTRNIPFLGTRRRASQPRDSPPRIPPAPLKRSST